MSDLGPERPLYRWAEVDIGALRHNCQFVRSRLPGAAVIAVVKANGYGHGALAAARAALGGGAWGLAVATMEEAAALQDACVPERILILNGLVPADVSEAVRKGFAVTLGNPELLPALQAGADPDRPLPVHLKIDTGMGRLGVPPEAAPELARAVAGTPGLKLVGTLTHFAAPESDPDLTRRQFARFLTALEHLGVEPGLRHACNSIAALRYPEMALDAIRLGIALYGCEAEGVHPALRLRGTVLQVKTVAAGATVGYGATWRAERSTRVATVAMGYADGVFRSRSNEGWALVRGGRAPLLGRVSMDLVTLDVSAQPEVVIGDAVTFIGRDGDEEVTAEMVARWSGTISYEVLTAIGARVVRRYLE